MNAQSNCAMTFNFGLILLEGVTLAVVVFGALAVFMVRRWFSPSSEATKLPGPLPDEPAATLQDIFVETHPMHRLSDAAESCPNVRVVKLQLAETTLGPKF